MNRGLMNSLSEADRLLVAETERDAMAALTEDELVELHKRVRKQRSKYLSIYRRSAAERVREHGGRGKARPKNRRNADRLEVFEDALSRVSRTLATAARQSAADLRAERIAAAREASANPMSAPQAPAATSSGRSSAKGATAKDTARKTPRTRKNVASTRAAGARRQAKRDSR